MSNNDANDFHDWYVSADGNPNAAPDSPSVASEGFDLGAYIQFSSGFSSLPIYPGHTAEDWRTQPGPFSGPAELVLEPVYGVRAFEQHEITKGLTSITDMGGFPTYRPGVNESLCGYGRHSKSPGFSAGCTCGFYAYYTTGGTHLGSAFSSLGTGAAGGSSQGHGGDGSRDRGVQVLKDRDCGHYCSPWIAPRCEELCRGLTGVPGDSYLLLHYRRGNQLPPQCSAEAR